MLYQLIVLALFVLSLGVQLADAVHKDKPGEFLFALLSVFVMSGLLYGGGFFDCFFR